MNNRQYLSENVYLTDKDLAARYQVKRSSVWRWVRSGILPPPVKISEGCSRWVKSEIETRDAERLATR